MSQVLNVTNVIGILDHKVAIAKLAMRTPDTRGGQCKRRIRRFVMGCGLYNVRMTYPGGPLRKRMAWRGHLSCVRQYWRRQTHAMV